jgi:hypothetical protein
MPKDILLILAEKIENLGTQEIEKAEMLLDKYIEIEKSRGYQDKSSSGKSAREIEREYEQFLKETVNKINALLPKLPAAQAALIQKAKELEAARHIGDAPAKVIVQTGERLPQKALDVISKSEDTGVNIAAKLGK